MADFTNQDGRPRRAIEIFDKLRGQRKTDQEIFAEAAKELKQLARKMTAHEPAGGSLHATRLLNDAYVKLFDRPQSDFEWDTGEEFFLAVAQAMHDLIRDHFRKKMAVGRGRGKVSSLDQLKKKDEQVFNRLGAPAEPIHKNVFEDEHLEAEAVEHTYEALARLREEFPERAKAIELTHWGVLPRLDSPSQNDEADGLTRQQVAQILKKSPETIKKDLEKGRARMKHYLSTKGLSQRS
jgi:RNA polymerase sigma factor (sigma-70 family)